MDSIITDKSYGVTLAVTDVPDMAVPHTKMTIIPSKLQISYSRSDDGRHVSIKISGPRRLKSGAVSEFWSDCGYLRKDNWPDWVKDLVADYTPDWWS